MNQVIACAGFLGAWLLVDGPLYQGALELDEEEVDREGIEASAARIPRPDPPSAWWWLLPPVMYLIRRRRHTAFRRTALARLTDVQREQLTGISPLSWRRSCERSSPSRCEHGLGSESPGVCPRVATDGRRHVRPGPRRIISSSPWSRRRRTPASICCCAPGMASG
jgi:hypothetical protein